MDNSRLNKFQHQFWVTKETVYRKLGKKEQDESIVSSDASLDAKLELFKSITQTSAAMNKLLDRYQERICYLAQEQNAMGRFLKEFGKSDKTNAGKMMISMGKSLIVASQQEITLRPPLLRLYQEVETFRHRAVEDTLSTIRQMERHRTEYRASLKWMKNVSQELDPDTYKQMEKFRKVQSHVKKSKAQFDKLKLAVLQKVDLLAAARCNMFSHALIHYQTSTMKTTEKIAQVFRTLAISFKGHQHYEFSVIKELAELPRKPAESSSGDVPPEMLLDLEKEPVSGTTPGKKEESEDEVLLDISEDNREKNLKESLGNDSSVPVDKLIELSAEEFLSNERLLQNLLGGPNDTSPDTETASEALDLTLSWPSTENKEAVGAAKGPKKEKSASELLSDEFDNLPFEADNPDTLSLLNELLTSTGATFPTPQQPLVPASGSEDNSSSVPPLSSNASVFGTNSGFFPSELLNVENILNQGDLLNFNASPLPATTGASIGTAKPGRASVPFTGSTAWYDIFADLDPIANPDAIGKKEEQNTENRYC